MSKKICSTISELPEDLLLKILSFLSTKHAVVTSLLSKQWKFLWTKMSRLEYDVSDHKDHTSFEQFIDKSLFLHPHHVLESLYFRLNSMVKIGPWISRVFHYHHCYLRELQIDAGAAYTPIPHELFTCKTLVVLKLQGEQIKVEALTTVCLPSLKTLHTDHSLLFASVPLKMLLSNCNLLTDLKIIWKSGLCFFKFDVSWCKRLVALKLEGLMDVISISSSSAVCLPFLNTLHVTHIWKLNNDSFCRLLSSCPLLSDLTLEEKTSDVMLDLNIVMPCLQRLSIITKFNSSTHLCSLLENYIRKLAIIAPSFKYFTIQEVMLLPIYIPFYVRVRLGDPSKLEYTSVFDRIVHLEQSICDEVSQRTLVDLLRRFTKLVVLKLENVYRLTLKVYRWDTPSFVPECLLSSLEALEWRRYTGKDRDKGLMSYLLSHALCLKTVKIFSDVENKQQIVEDLASMPRGSKSCQLVFK